MTQLEFGNFIISLGNSLGVKLEAIEIGNVFNFLQKSGKVSYFTFEKYFDN